MNQPPLFKLDQDPKGRGLRCDEDGLFLAGEPLLARDSRGQFRPRSHHVLRKAFQLNVSAETDLSSHVRSVEVIANSLNQRNLAHAMMAAVLMRVPETQRAARGVDADRILAKANFDPNEARDDHGRWSNSGGGSDSNRTFVFLEPPLVEPLIEELVRPFPDIIDIVPPVTNWKNPGAVPTNPYPNRPECVEEWDHAREFCERLWRKRKLGTNDYSGLGRTIRECMMGQVSEDCGGYPVARA